MLSVQRDLSATVKQEAKKGCRAFSVLSPVGYIHHTTLLPPRSSLAPPPRHSLVPQILDAAPLGVVLAVLQRPLNGPVLDGPSLEGGPVEGVELAGALVVLILSYIASCHTIIYRCVEYRGCELVALFGFGVRYGYIY